MYEYIAESTREFLGTAQRLNDGECGAGYYEASSILVNVLSALSSIAWPVEDKTTRKRFVETLIRFSDSAYRITNVSIPLFADAFIEDSAPERKNAAVALRPSDAPPVGIIIRTGNDIDIDSDQLVLRYPCFTKPEVRKFSYADLLYGEVRCGLVHAYSLGKAVPFSLTKRNVLVSYVNSSDPETPSKMIHFHFNAMLSLVKGIAENLAREKALPLNAPAQWWIEGA